MEFNNFEECNKSIDYQKSINFINSHLAFGIKPGLDRIGLLLDYLGNPQKKLKFIHVAGTNGKGSTCNMISSVLSSAGYKTGLFTSPFVLDFRERMQINGEMISQKELISTLKSLIPFIEKLEDQKIYITEFELITAMAFKWFEKNKCDVVVLEVGLGGRFDATNIIETPLVSAITSISLDHTKILGHTVEKIAEEKSGIIKMNGTTVLYPDQVDSVKDIIIKTCDKKNNSLIVPNLEMIKLISSSIDGSEFYFENTYIKLPLIGEHQVKNFAVVMSVIKVLGEIGFNISDKNIQDGILNVKIVARLEVISKNPLIIIDGAHNESGAKVLAQTVRAFFGDKKIIGIMGVLEDKDVNKIIKELIFLCNHLITVAPNNSRAMSANKLAEKAKEFCDKVEDISDLEEAVLKALSLADDESVVLIFGSLYLAGEIRPIILKNIKNILK